LDEADPLPGDTFTPEMVMKILRYPILLLPLISHLLVLPARAQTGSLEGIVEDADGNVIDRARVILARDEGEYLERAAISDKSGHFVFQNLADGKYFVYAKKEESGLPDSMFAFFAIGQPKPTPVAIPGTVSPIVIRTGKPDGFLRCIVRDEAGKPVAGAQYRLYSIDNPQLLVVSGADKEGKIQTLVPGVPIVLQMEAVGYKLWRSDPMLITQGETKALTINLIALASRR
jgi:uncharacterized surface anchored protein